MSFALSALPRIAACALAAVLLAPCIAAAQTPSPFSGTPAAIPGIIQAEAFDRGGQGVAYNDTTPTVNDGGQLYRGTEGVDIFGAPEQGNFVVKNFALGEWMTYTVEVAANGRYDFQVRVASKVDTARFHIEIDGNDVTGSVAVPHTSTTTWEAYQWFVVKKRVPLTAGTHVMKIVSDAEWVGLDAFNITASFLGTPFGGTPAAIPGIIQAENFNEGGEGVAYHDTDSRNDGLDAGVQYRTNEAVDLFTSPGSPDYVVKNFATGEWMVYSVNVATSGIYDFKARVATKLDTSRFHIEIDGVNVTGSVAVPHTSTTTWEDYQWIVAKTFVPLEAGTHYLVIASDEQWVGLDAIEVVPGYSGTPHSGTPAAVPGTIQAENFDDGGEGVAYHDTDSRNDGVDAGVQYRTTEAVDLFTSPGAPEPGNYVVKNFNTGEWMAYTINVQTTGQYDLKVRLASKIDTEKLHFEIDGNNVTGTYLVPNTGGWEVYQLHTVKTNLQLTAGTHVLKVVSDEQWPGLDYFQITPSDPGVVEFSCDFENGWVACGFAEQKFNDGQPRATIGSTFSRDGAKAVRLLTKPTDNGVSNSNAAVRDDLSLGSLSDCAPGKEQWWAHSTLFPDDFHPPADGPDEFGVFFDFHHEGPLGGEGQANFVVTMVGNRITFYGFGGATVGHSSRDPGFFRGLSVIDPIQRNHWYDFVYHVKWSPNADGFFRAWVDGKLMVDHHGATLYEGHTCYLKLANYHTQTEQNSAIVHDRVKRGTNPAAVVVPGQTLE